jgi:hypothetical protein
MHNTIIYIVIISKTIASIAVNQAVVEKLILGVDG